MATVNLSVNVGESKKITFHSGGTYNPEDIVFDVSANGSGYKPIQTAVSSPTASSTATAFIDTISQNTNGVITATKKNLPTASSTVAGITKIGASGGAAAYSHNHTTSIATSTGTNQITLAFGTKYAISAGGTSYVFTMPANPNSDTKVTQTYAAESDYTYWRPLVIGYSSNATEGFTPSTSTDTTYTFSTLTCQPSSGTIRAKSFKIIGGKSSQFLKADGSVDSNAYSTTSHNHSGVYKPVQAEVSDPTASTTTSTTFIDSISQNANGVITATKKTLPSYATSNHTHATSIATSNEDSRITLAFGTKYVIKAGGTSYVFAMPKNPNTDTTYTIATGDSNGQIKVTPSSGNAYNVSVKGLGSAAYTDSSAYATSGHTHTGFAASSHTHATSIATSTGTNKITLAFGTKYAITAGGTSYVFTMPANPNTNTTYTIATGDAKGQIKVTPSSGDAYNVSVKGLGSAAYTESSAYATSGHNHSGVYKPIQAAVSSPSATSTTSTTFIDTISQNTNGVIAATKKTLPTASATVAGITKVGASGGAATYDHTHTTSIATSTGTNQITLAFGGKYAITAGGTSYVFTMPANPDTDVKVKQTAHTITDATEYPIITTTSASPTSGTAYEAKYATHAAVTGSGDIVLKKSSNKCKLQFDNSLNCLNFIFE